MADFAEAAVAAATSDATSTPNPTPSNDRSGASGQDGDNKFQKAISAWRSKNLFSSSSGSC
jgi:homeobox protein cut-like